MSRLRTLCGVMVVLLFVGRAAAGPDVDPQVVALTRDGNQAAIARVESLVCRFTHEVVSEDQPGLAAGLVHRVDGWYRRSGDVVRTSYQNPGAQFTDILIRDGRGWEASSHPKVDPNSISLGTAVFTFLPAGNVWSQLLFEFVNGHVPLRERSYARLLDGSTTVKRAGWVTDGGRRLARVEIDTGKLVMAFWFDPAKNYLIHKARWGPFAPDGSETEQEVLAYAEAPGGVFVPTTVEQRLLKKGKVVAVTRTVLTDVRVNRPVPAADLRLPGIAGKKCVDMDTKREYVVDTDGRQVGEAKSATFVSLPPTPYAPAATEPRPPSRPPWPWWWYALGAAVLAFGAGAYVRFRRRGE